MARLYVPLDVNFPDDDKIIAVGLDGAGLYAMALCIAKRMNRDGHLTRTHLTRLGASDDLIDCLVKHDLVRADTNGHLQITAWLGHNDSAEVIEEKRAKEAQRKRLTRGKRPRGHTADVPADSESASATVEGREGKGKGREENDNKLSSRRGFPQGGPDDDLQQLAVQVARCRADRLGRANASAAWVNAVARSLDPTRLVELHRAGQPPNEIDRLLDGPEPVAQTTPLDGTLASDLARMARNSLPDRGCEECEGTGMAVDESNTAQPCVTCNGGRK